MRRRSTLCTAFILAGLVITAYGSDWPMFGYDEAHTGWNTAENTLMPPLREVWRATVPGSPEAVAVREGVVYVSIGSATGGTGNNAVAAYQGEDGAQQFVFYLPGAAGTMNCAPAVGYGKVFVGGQNEDKVYAINATTGAEEWSVANVMSFYARPVTLANGLVYANPLAGTALALDPADGSTVWTYTMTATRSMAPTVGGGLVCVVDDRNLVALDANTGALVWTAPDVANHFVTPTVVGGTIFICDPTDGALRALDLTTGAEIWKVTVPGQARGILCAADGQLYATVFDNGSGMAELRALAQVDGRALWTYTSDAKGISCAVANGVVWVSELFGKQIVALDPATGAELSTALKLSGNVTSATPADGKLFVCVGTELIAYEHDPAPNPQPGPQPSPRGCRGGALGGEPMPGSELLMFAGVAVALAAAARRPTRD